MAEFIHGQANIPTDPLLELYVIDENDDPIDVEYVNFRVVDITTDVNKCHYMQQNLVDIQIYPNKGGKFIDTNNLYTDPAPGHKLSTGRYYAPWTAGAHLRTGEYVIIWEWKLSTVEPYRRTTKNFVIKEAD